MFSRNSTTSLYRACVYILCFLNELLLIFGRILNGFLVVISLLDSPTTHLAGVSTFIAKCNE